MRRLVLLALGVVLVFSFGCKKEEEPQPKLERKPRLRKPDDKDKKVGALILPARPSI
jgi:hypothetical protein